MAVIQIRKSLAALCFTLIAGTGFAKTAEEFLGSSFYKKLMENGGKFERVADVKDSVNLYYLPNGDFKSKIVNVWTSQKQPVKVFEEIYVINKSNFKDPSRINIENLSVISREISKMKGMTYFSSKKKWETLYKDCSTIESMNSKVKVADKTSGTANNKTIYCYLDDNSLGKINYRVNYYQDDDELVGYFKNTSSIWIGPIKAVDENNICICFQFIDCEDELIVYLVTEANIPTVPFIENKLNKSLASRLNAVYKWFVGKF